MDLVSLNDGREKYYVNKLYNESLSKLIENLNFSVIFFNIFALVMILLSKISDFDNSNEEITAEKKSIPSHIVNFLFLTGTITLGFAANNKKSSKLLTIYIISLIVINFNLCLGDRMIFDIIIIKIDSANIEKLFYFIIFALSFSISLSLIFEFFHSEGYTKLHSEILHLNYLIKETKIKLDLMKISINSLIISFGLHRYLPFILFKKRDLYFLTDSAEETGKDDRTNYKKLKCADNEDDHTNSFSTTYSDTALIK